MAFNLRQVKKAQLTDIDVAKLRDMIMTNFNTVKGLQGPDAEDAAASFELQLQGLGTTVDEAKMLVPELADILEQSRRAQDNIPAIETDPNAPQVFNPIQKEDSSKAFNFKKASAEKKAQQPQVPWDPMGLNDQPEIMGDQYEMQQQVMNQPNISLASGADVRTWLENSTYDEVMQIIVDADAGPSADAIQTLVRNYYDTLGDKAYDPDKERKLEKIAGKIYDILPTSLTEETTIMAPKEQYTAEADEAVKKLAQESRPPAQRKSSSSKVFNLKTAQHKTQENVIMWGPHNTRKVDPFLRQPVSDWHIVERNKGFGLVVDDVWNIDWETLWRENVMDKYSRPYRDKDGNWVGGYIQKRFEVDKNIPVTSNYQLKPGEKRKPIMPEYGNTESRLQAARAAGDVAGALDTSKPFNWKAAKKQTKMKKQAGGMIPGESFLDYYVRATQQEMATANNDIEMAMDLAMVPDKFKPQVQQTLMGTKPYTEPGLADLGQQGIPVNASTKKKS